IQGWTGYDCSEPECPTPCQHQGNCTLPGVCTCAPGWTGEYCGIATCAQVRRHEQELGNIHIFISGI
ncbi:unnamed protein product, partial [Ectocarpus sp. 12 AP-2014]